MSGSKGRRQYGDGALFYKGSRDLWMVRLDLGRDADGNRKRWEATSRTREGALNKLRQARTDIATLGTIPTSAMTTQAWLERWLEDIVRPHVKPGTFSDYRQTVTKHLIPRIGRVPIATLSPTHVRTMYKAVSDESSLGNANKAHRVLRAALSDAEREGIVPRNVAKLVKTTKSKVSRGALTNADARLIIGRASTPMGSRWATELLTGARQGETLGLQWDRVDLDAATIDISWQLQQQTPPDGLMLTALRSVAYSRTCPPSTSAWRTQRRCVSVLTPSRDATFRSPPTPMRSHPGDRRPAEPPWPAPPGCTSLAWMHPSLERECASKSEWFRPAPHPNRYPSASATPTPKHKQGTPANTE
jgi:integrase